MKATIPKTVSCKADSRTGVQEAAKAITANAAWYKTHAKALSKAVKAVESSKLDKTVDDAQALYDATSGKVQDDKTRASLLDAIKKRDADAIGKAVKTVNESKAAKEKADAEAKAKPNRRPRPRPPLRPHQSQRQAQSYTPSYTNTGTSSGRSYTTSVRQAHPLVRRAARRPVGQAGRGRPAADTVIQVPVVGGLLHPNPTLSRSTPFLFQGRSTNIRGTALPVSCANVQTGVRETGLQWYRSGIAIPAPTQSSAESLKGEEHWVTSIINGRRWRC